MYFLNLTVVHYEFRNPGFNLISKKISELYNLEVNYESEKIFQNYVIQNIKYTLTFLHKDIFRIKKL